MELTELTQITLLLCSALVGGLLLRWFKQPPLLGYMLAGVALGPFGYELIERDHNLTLLAELGVTLLLFIIGMELSLQAFKRVYKEALFVVMVQLLFSLLAIYIIGVFFDWPLSRVVVLGFAISISSTAVGINMLDEIGELRTDLGKMAVGILIAQDLAVPLFLIVINSLGAIGGFSTLGIFQLLFAIMGLVVLIWYLSKKERVTIPFLHSLPEGSSLVVLTGLSICFLFAALSGFLGLSAAFGAFVGGLIIGASKDRRRVLEGVMPIQEILLMVFFLTIGLLVDVTFIMAHWIQIAALLFLVLVVKSIVNILALRLTRQSWNTATVCGVTLAQIGEFSFVIAALGLHRSAISDDGYKYLVALIALSLMVSPLFLATARRLVGIRPDTEHNTGT